eukprot:5285264-Pleurochrysis_carterae.AAC.2
MGLQLASSTRGQGFGRELSDSRNSRGRGNLRAQECQRTLGRTMGQKGDHLQCQRTLDRTMGHRGDHLLCQRTLGRTMGQKGDHLLS